MLVDYSHYFNNKIRLFLTQANDYWDRDYPNSRKNKIIEYFQIKDKKVIIPKQIHSDLVINLSENSNDLECDAIIYKQESNLVGAIHIADCVPICIYDNQTGYIALIHSGWKGTLKKITIKTINRLLELGSDKDSLKIFIGPSIRSCCYQVEDFFASKFHPLSVSNKRGVFFVDLTIQTQIDLEGILIPKKNIFIDNLCTFDNHNCHSFRRDKQQSGRMSFIAY